VLCFSCRQPKDALEEAKGAALRLLSLRSHSRKEIQNKLLERGHDFEPALGAIDRLQEVGLQSDKEFAEAFARSKWRQVKWGPSKIKSVRRTSMAILYEHLYAMHRINFSNLIAFILWDGETGPSLLMNHLCKDSPLRNSDAWLGTRVYG